MSNRLKSEISPYLLQHVDNPVDWFPWGEEAFILSRNSDKPILLSIGYASCHWCHVMAHESFENPEIAKIMNANFVCIKVDREERPDIDSIYMNAVQALTGHGGWPLTIFLTPDKLPFYGGTYFPPKDSRGLPGFDRVLNSIKEAYANRREDVNDSARALTDAVFQIVNSDQSSDQNADWILSNAFLKLKDLYDPDFGGFGSAPKFPQPLVLKFLLSYYKRTQDSDSLKMLTTTLDSLSNGGIYDHLGGGFHRYSVDRAWKIPHFEKMLYDNALLAIVYAEAFQLTGDAKYRQISEQTLDYLIREMLHPAGGFYSSQDADTDGVEGKFYTWDSLEIEKVLGAGFKPFEAYYGISSQGNWEGTNILHSLNYSKSISGKLNSSRDALFQERLKREHPSIDDKVVTAWNGLAIQAFAQASQIFCREDYREIAIKTASFFIDRLHRENGLSRIWRNSIHKQEAYLEDFGSLIQGFINLHEATLDQVWLKHAYNFTKQMIDLFYEKSSARFFDTSINQESLFVRPSQLFDGPTPSGASTATKCLFWLAQITGEKEFELYAKQLLNSAGSAMLNYPHGHGNWLTVLEFSASKISVVAIAGDKNKDETLSLKQAVHSLFSPNTLLVGWNPSEATFFKSPLFANRSLVNDQPTAFLCLEFQCQLPTSDPMVLLKQLQNV